MTTRFNPDTPCLLLYTKMLAFDYVHLSDKSEYSVI